MATIQASIQLKDGMSPALRVIEQTLGAVIERFDRLQHSLDKALNPAAVNTTNAALNTTQAQVNRIETEINENTAAQNKFNNSVKSGGSIVSGLVSKMGMLLGAYTGIHAVGGIVKTADQLTMTKARLDLMNDGLQTTEQLQEKIYQAAQRSRGAYADTADAVAKLGLRAGSIFKNNDETIQFTETLNKMFVIAGASQTEMSSATLQLTQALGSGVLRGEEFNAVFEAAPNVMQAVADHIGQPIGALKKLASEGKISAQVVKDAIFGATDKINEQFNNMPVTFAQAWQNMKNKILDAAQPILQTLSDITSSERFQKFADGVGTAIERVIGFFQNVGTVVTPILGAIYDSVSGICNFFSDHWDVIAPLVWAVVIPMAALKTVSMAVATWTAIVSAATAIKNTVMGIAAARTAMVTGATLAQTAAQWGLNTALLACPITWIILAIIALVAIFYAAVAAVNHFAGTSYSATGFICGAFKWLGAVIANIFIGIYNIGAGVIQAVVNAWHWGRQNIFAIFDNIGIWWDNLWIDAYIGFCDFITKVLSKLSTLAQKIQPVADLLDIDLSSVINGAQDKIGAARDTLASSKKQYKKYTQFKAINWQSQSYFNLDDAYQSGYDWGAEKAAQAENFMKGMDFTGADKIKELEGLMEKYGVNNQPASGNATTPAVTGGTGGAGGAGDIADALSKSPALDSLAKSTDGLADEVANLSKTISVSDEEMNTIRQLATREILNQVTRNSINIQMTNNNQVKDGMDVQAMAKELARQVQQEIEASSEGIRR